jgi:hypothetical protein
MVFKLSQFRSSLNSYGVAKTNTYEVIISPPPPTNVYFQFAVDTSLENLRQLSLRCSSVQLPELDLLTLPYYSKVTGVAENRVIGLNQFKIIPMEFIVDADMKSVNFFQNWLQFIVNYSAGNNFQAVNGNQLPYEVSYINEYAGTVEINVYPSGMQGNPGEDGTNTKFQQYRLIKAFPVNMGNIQLRWDSTDAQSVMILPVGFTYSAIEVPKMNGPNTVTISSDQIPPNT